MSEFDIPRLVERTLQSAKSIQQIAAPTFHEKLRAQWVASRFQDYGFPDVEIDRVGNVYARLPGHDAPPVAITAHLDTVFPQSTPLAQRESNGLLYGPGIGDNSLGLAACLELAQAYRAQQKKLPGDVWFIANVCEEGLGDLRGIRAVWDHLPTPPLAWIILEGIGLGAIHHRGLGAERYRLVVRTQGGHSWADYGRPSAIHEGARLAANLAKISTSVHPRTSLNIGVMRGGVSVNTIASEAEMEIDLRSESPKALANLRRKVLKIADRARRAGVAIDVQQIGDRPAGEISVEHPLVRLAIQAVRGVGLEPHLDMASTDANYPLSRGAAAVCVGITRGGEAHTPGEFIETGPITLGMRQLVHLVNHVWQIHLPD